MDWEFEDLNDLKRFALYLSNQLTTKNQVKFAQEVSYFSENTYTTSSEYLGEYRLLLNRLLSEEELNNDCSSSIKKAIKSIDKAFAK